MPSYFIPAFLMAILHIQSTFVFVDLSNIRVLRLFHDSTAKEIRSCISTSGQYCVVNFSFIDRVNETNRTYQNLVAIIQVYMSNKTQTSNCFSLLRKSGSYKNMLNFMAIAYIVGPRCEKSLFLSKLKPGCSTTEIS